MPINDKQRAFIAEYLTNGHNATDAYRKAYPKCNSGHKENGCRLLTKDNVKAEIARIRAKMELKSERTVQSIDEMQQAAYDLAMQNNQPSAAVSAGQAIARLYGMDKQTVVSQHTPDQPQGQEADVLNNLNKQYKLRLAGTAPDSPTEGKAGQGQAEAG